MANPEHLKILKQGVEVWNQWREENPCIRPDLRSADLKGVELKGVNLSGADLKGADLHWADLTEATLVAADLNKADLSGAYLKGAQLEGCNLSAADLKGALLPHVFAERRRKSRKLIIACMPHASAVLFLTAAAASVGPYFDPPYGFFILLRWIVAATAAYSVFGLLWLMHRLNFVPLFLAVAVLFNPVWPITLEPDTWFGIDLLVSGLFVTWWFILSTLKACGGGGEHIPFFEPDYSATSKHRSLEAFGEVVLIQLIFLFFGFVLYAMFAIVVTIAAIAVVLLS